MFDDDLPVDPDTRAPSNKKFDWGGVMMIVWIIVFGLAVALLGVGRVSPAPFGHSASCSAGGGNVR